MNWGKSDTSPDSIWKNPLESAEHNLRVADGAIHERDLIIRNLREQLKRKTYPSFGERLLHADEIHAWAEGAKVEMRITDVPGKRVGSSWIRQDHPMWYQYGITAYRVEGSGGYWGVWKTAASDSSESDGWHGEVGLFEDEALQLAIAANANEIYSDSMATYKAVKMTVTRG